MRRLATVALAAALLAAGCGAAKHRHDAVTASVIRASTMCGGEGGGVTARWIGSEGALLAAIGAGGLFGDTAPPKIDFSKEGVLGVYMGQRPTAGYGLALQDPGVAVADRVATVVVRFEEPAPGAMVPQVLTSPCLLVRLPRKDLREVRVVDPAGTVRATVTVPRKS